MELSLTQTPTCNFPQISPKSLTKDSPWINRGLDGVNAAFELPSYPKVHLLHHQIRSCIHTQTHHGSLHFKPAYSPHNRTHECELVHQIEGNFVSYPKLQELPQS